MRLDKYIANNTSYSRKEVKKRLKDAAVEVNQQISIDGKRLINPDVDKVAVDGKTIVSQGKRYFMLNKPLNTVCANSDSLHPTVIGLLEEPNKDILQIAGRLDKDTTGLVLITDDGQWNHRVTSPSKQCYKTYRVKLKEAINDFNKDEMMTLFKNGIQLRNETKLTAPAKLTVLNEHCVELAISEGKYHQVKRMFAAVNNHVLELHRISIGNIILDTKLAPGEYRPLTLKETTDFAN